MNEIGKRILRERYARVKEDGNHEDWSDLCWRVATALASMEKPEKRDKCRDEFFHIIFNRYFIPAGRVLRSAGIDGENCANCYILPVLDSKESIGELLKDVYLISCNGGGVGISFSSIRPRLSEIGNGRGFSTGIIPVMQMVDSVGEQARAGGSRRAALLALLSITHPDTLDFLHAKSVDGRLINFNISIDITPEFTKAVIKDKEWHFSFRGRTYYPYSILVRDEYFTTLYSYDKESAERKAVGALLHEGKGDRIDEVKVKEEGPIKARDLWRQIVSHALTHAEPGLMNLSLANETNNGWYFENIECTNPCLTGDMTLLTGDGYKKLEDLADLGETSVINIHGDDCTGKVWKVGERKVVSIHLDNGNVLKSTPDHVWGAWEETVREYGTFSVVNEVKAEDLLGKTMAKRDSDGGFIEYGKVVEIKHLGEEEMVYDFSEENKHWGIVNGYLCHNCSEYTGSAYSSCILGSLDLATFVVNGEIDYKLLGNVIKTAIRILDNVVDLSKYPLSKISEVTSNSRNIGMGAMGFHHMLIKLGIPYASDSCFDVIDAVFSFIRDTAFLTSTELSKEKGAFPAFSTYQYCKGKFFATLPRKIKAKVRTNGMRNCRLMALAPSGSIHNLAGDENGPTSFGIEPIPGRVYRRKDGIGERVIVDPKLRELLLAGFPTDHINSAHELDPSDHLRVQAAIQNYIDNSISKTTLLRDGWQPEEGEVIEYMEKILMQFLPEIKGTTLYQEGSREHQIITVISREDEDKYIEEALTEERDHCKNGICDI